MKIVLIALIFALIINFTSAFLWFDHRTTKQTKLTTTSSTSRRSTFPVQQPVNQQKNQSRNTTNLSHRVSITTSKNNQNRSTLQVAVHRLQNQVRNTTVTRRSTVSISNRSSRIVLKNKFRAILHQKQQSRPLNHSTTSRQINRIPNTTSKFGSNLSVKKNNTTVVNPVNHRVSSSTILSRFIVLNSKPKSSPIAQNPIQQFSTRLLLPKGATASSKSTLLRTLTTKGANNNVIRDRQRTLEEYYQQEQFREFYQRFHKQNTASIQGKVNPALKRRKRDGRSDIIAPDGYNSMVFVRRESVIEEQR